MISVMNPKFGTTTTTVSLATPSLTPVPLQNENHQEGALNCKAMVVTFKNGGTGVDDDDEDNTPGDTELVPLATRERTETHAFFQMTFSLSHMLAMSSTCYNPILYAWLNETFRKEFKEVLPCWRSYEDDNGRVSNRLVGRQSLYSKPHHVEDEDEDAGNNATPSHHRHHHNHNNHRHHNHGKGLDEGDADVETGSGHPQPRRKNTEMISVMNPKFGTTTTTVSLATPSLTPVPLQNENHQEGALNCKAMVVTFKNGGTGVDDDDEDNTPGDTELVPLATRERTESNCRGLILELNTAQEPNKRAPRRLLTSDL
ncbi:unnamed protein product [Notodromas monacha]|uniref:Uncharacterized protein n=1 Tax=Notodromas monacha TaxID=399045 RepID=A0A7R9BSA4_9CRUS|nr:unnamed protein product [Notodromas monacha]CAG0920764.1 unnamed protein product [Notodromas monacha]